MKQLSEAQQNLIKCLKFLKLEEDVIILIIILLKDDNQIAKIAEFLDYNPNATQGQIIEQAIKISEPQQNKI